MKKPRCIRCKKVIGAARVVIKEFYWCPDCVYAVEVAGEPREISKETSAA